MADGFSPPESVRNNAKRGLELRREFNRGGTAVGVARARDLSNGKSLPLVTINRMVSYFARHEVDKKGKDWGNTSNPSAGYIAWHLWGGDSGRTWANSIANREKKDKSMATDFTTSYAAIIKQEKQEDGTLLVYGKATDDSIDIDQQICDAGWLNKAMPEWFKTGGNIREQHSNIAAGVAKELDSKADGHYISALVVDPVSIKKVEAGVLKGFSIGIRGPRIVRDNKAANGRIIDGQIVEVSLVDRPANPHAKLMLAKSDGTEVIQVEEMIENEEVVQEVVQVEEIKLEESQDIPTEVVEEKALYGEGAEEENDKGVYMQAEEEMDKAETTDCDCAGCNDCAEKGGCDKVMCKGHAETKSVTKCLECGCNQVGNPHGGGQTVLPDGTTSNMSMATMITPENSPKSADAVLEKSTITPLPTIERVGEVSDDQVFESEDSEKSALSDDAISAIIEKAVKSATETVRNEIDSLKSAKEAATIEVNKLQTELATANQKAVSGGPKRSVIKGETKSSDEFARLASEYRTKAANTSDPLLARGYKDLAKDFEAKSALPTN